MPAKPRRAFLHPGTTWVPPGIKLKPGSGNKPSHPAIAQALLPTFRFVRLSLNVRERVDRESILA